MTNEDFIYESLALSNDFYELKLPYDWMVKKIISRIGEPPSGVSYPIWAWHTWEGKRKRRDLRKRGYGNKGTKLVQMEIEVPDQEVFLTDFDLWVAILNGFNLNIESEEGFENDWYCLQAAENSEHYADYKKDIIESWDKCIEPAVHNEMYMPDVKSIQATFWEIRSEYVKRTQPFVCR